MNTEKCEKKSIKIKKPRCPCSVSQLLSIFIPISLLGLFCAIFLPIYLITHKKKTQVFTIIEDNNNSTNNNDDYDEFTEYEANYTYAKFNLQ